MENVELIQLREEVNNLKEIVESLAILMNKKLVHELYEEYKNIESGDYLTEEQFEKKIKLKFVNVF